MDKDKEQIEIEEMARTNCGRTYKNCYDCVEYSKKILSCVKLKDCEAYSFAKALYNAGYRKLPDGATVLLVGKYNQALDEKTIEYFVKHNKQIRKETAREILQPLYDACKDDSYGQVVVDFAILERLAKQFGVEIKEW